MSLLSSLKTMFAAHKIAGRADLRTFIESRSAYLVQKSITEYTQARAGMLFSTMMREPLFIEGYERARWLSYPASISMVAEMVEGSIRERAMTAPGTLDAALRSIADEILAQFPGPSGQPDFFWHDAVDRLVRDLAQAALGPPKPVQNIPLLRAQEIFDALPVNPRIKQHDFPMFRNTLRFHLTEIKVEFEEKSNPAQLLAGLSA